MYAVTVAVSVIIMGGFLDATLTKESQIPQAEHVEGRQSSCKQPNKPYKLADRTGRDKRLIKNLVLAEESGQRRCARNRENAHGHRPESDGNLLPQPAHHAHILLTAQGMDDRTGREKEQRLEKGMR